MKVTKRNLLGDCYCCGIRNHLTYRRFSDRYRSFSIPNPMAKLFNVIFYKKVYILCKDCIKEIKKFRKLKRGGMKITKVVLDEFKNIEEQKK